MLVSDEVSTSNILETLKSFPCKMKKKQKKAFNATLPLPKNSFSDKKLNTLTTAIGSRFSKSERNVGIWLDIVFQPQVGKYLQDSTKKPLVYNKQEKGFEVNNKLFSKKKVIKKLLLFV